MQLAWSHADVSHPASFLFVTARPFFAAEDRFAGSTDVPLSDEGREQARRLAARLASEKVAGIFSSDMARTMETAQILAEPHGIEVKTYSGLREISHGHWEEMTRREVEKQYPEEALEWEKDPYNLRPDRRGKRSGGDRPRAADPDPDRA